MKVVFILPGRLPVPAVRGGAIESLLNNLLEFNEEKKSFEAAVFSEYDKDAQHASREYSHTHFIYINRGGFYKIINIFFKLARKMWPRKLSYLDIHKIVRQIKRFKPDRIVIEGSFLKLLELSKFFPKEQLIFRLHADLINRRTPETDRVLRSASLFMVASEFLRKRIEQNSGQNIPEVRILRNGIRCDFYVKITPEHKEELLKRHGISRSKPIILYVGRITQSKGILHLLDALTQARKTMDLHFLIVGSFGSAFGLGDEENEFTSRMRGLIEINHDWVSVTGFVNNRDLPAYYQISDILVVPSICEDVSPLVVNEALASGTPLIVTDAGGIAEYITDDCAVIVHRDERLVDNLCSAVCDLLKEPGRLAVMGAAALKESGKYTTTAFYGSFCEILSTSITGESN